MGIGRLQEARSEGIATDFDEAFQSFHQARLGVRGDSHSAFIRTSLCSKVGGGLPLTPDPSLPPESTGARGETRAAAPLFENLTQHSSCRSSRTLASHCFHPSPSRAWERAKKKNPASCKRPGSLHFTITDPLRSVASTSQQRRGAWHRPSWPRLRRSRARSSWRERSTASWLRSCTCRSWRRRPRPSG